MGRKKKIKKKDAICKYCKFFQGSDDRRLIKDGTSLIDYRKCPKAKKEVSDLTEACDQFEMNVVFWCDSDDCWINIKVCVNRHQKKVEGCVRCSQGKVIRGIILNQHQNENQNSVVNPPNKSKRKEKR